MGKTSGVCNYLSNEIKLSCSDEVRRYFLKVQVVVTEIMKRADVRFMELGNKGMKVREAVLAITSVNLDKRSLEIAEGARS